MLKKMVCGLLAAALLTGLTACAGVGNGRVTAQLSDGAPPEQSQETEQKNEAVTYRLDSYTVVDEQRSEDGVLLASCEYQMPQLTALHADGTPFDQASEGYTDAVKVMENVNQYFTDWLTEEKKWFAEMTQMAREDYALNGDAVNRWTADAGFYYSDTMAFSSWQNESLLSITMSTYGFTGGVHGYAAKTAVTFELYSGTIVHPSDLAADFSKLDAVIVDEILRQIEERKSGEAAVTYFDDYAATVKDWTERAVSVDASALTITFPAYDLAPYAMGEQVFQIPYELVRPYMSVQALAMLGLS